jgi:molybdenum cofactor synthesis domain-containing protein
MLVDSAAFLAIGDELLNGKVAEANLFPLSQTLRALGVSLRSAEVLGDDIGVLAAAIERLAAAHDLVVTSGGVGPTHDDVTIAAVAQAFGRRVVRDPGLLELVHATFRERTSEAHLRFADIPEGAELRNAPGVDWPTPVLENVWILPGVPEVFRMKLATLRTWLRGPRAFVTRALLLSREEAELKPALDAVVEQYPAVSIGSYPALFNPRYRTRVTFDGTQAELVGAALESLRKLVAAEWIVAIE